MLLVLAALLVQGLSEPHVPDGERTALLSLYRATNGDHWADHSSWGSVKPACDWQGVVCGYNPEDSSGHQVVVVGLSLDENRLSGVLPPDLLTGLPHLRFLSVERNALSGPMPEAILEAWDRHAFELRAAGNRFSNLAASVRIVSNAIGTLCSPTEDVSWQLDLESGGPATFQSVRCVPAKERETRCLVRRGYAFGLERVARALTALSAPSLAQEYSLPFSAATHQRTLLTIVRYGDGSEWELTTFDREGPIRAWLAQAALLSLADGASWSSERFEPRCVFVQ